MPKTINVPELSLVLLVGPSGAGKSTFAKKHFKPTEVISSDVCRGLVSDDETDQTCSSDAFEVLQFIASKRLRAGKLTVIDATNVRSADRKHLIDLARRHHALTVAIVLNLPDKLCIERNTDRADRNFGKQVIWHQRNELKRSLKSLKKKEGISHTYVLESQEEVDEVVIERQKLWNNKKDLHGPFDVIGDVHGCFNELMTLLGKLGYEIKAGEKYCVSHPEGRMLLFVGDLVDRGPNSPEVLRFVMDATEAGMALCVNGNHDDKLKRKLMGKDVALTHGIAETLEQLEATSEGFRERVLEFLKGLISHYVFDDGKLAIAHAGLKEHFIGRGSPRIRAFCMFGESTGETDEFGLPVRYPWAKDYRGEALVVYGHTPIPEPERLNNTINIDTGCVFGGELTAFRYPEGHTISVPAEEEYFAPVRPLDYDVKKRVGDVLLDIDDVLGKRIVATQLHRNVTIQEENAIAALEVMSRFALDPRWLIYLPPTMSPPETSKIPDLLEHPEEAIAYYRKRGIKELICEEKHMGSRAVVVICRDNKAAKRHFQISGDEIGVCYTRTGRSFFTCPETEKAFLAKVQEGISKAGLWEKLETEWMCLDCELLPWSAKAQTLLQQQYAPVGAAAEVALPQALEALKKAQNRNIEGVDALVEKAQARLDCVQHYRKAYRNYCWTVQSVDDYRLAPFHILAHEEGFNMTNDHMWHLGMIDRLCEAAPDTFHKTARLLVRTDQEESCQQAIDWWTQLTEAGGEGMVVKPKQFTVKSSKGLLQPGIKCRGREYLRIIYGPEYTLPQHLERLKARALKGKRSLALREYALGYEALHHFVQKAPLYKVHEAVFGVLAMESEPVDPRL